MAGKAYRSTDTGDRGFMVTENGKKYIVRDSVCNPVKRLSKEREWVLESEHRTLLPKQASYVVFQFEKALLHVMGHQKAAKMDWAMMTNAERAEYKQSTSEFPVVEGFLRPARKKLAALEE